MNVFEPCAALYGAGIGGVKEKQIRRLIGLESASTEFDTRSNHFSVESWETGFTRSFREIEVVPNFLAGLVMGKAEGVYVISSKTRFSLGSHCNTVTCFSLVLDKMLRLLFFLKNVTGCFLVIVRQIFDPHNLQHNLKSRKRPKNQNYEIQLHLVAVSRVLDFLFLSSRNFLVEYWTLCSND